MIEAVTKVIDTLTQEDIHGTFENLLERYSKCISAGGDYFVGDYYKKKCPYEKVWKLIVCASYKFNL